MSVQAAQLHPEQKFVFGDYDLDAVAVEYYDDTGQFDFRFELGSGVGIYWALPIERNGRLRLLHVDGAAYTVDEPELMADPWICDLPRIVWRGELATFRDGTKLLGVALEARSQPAWYRCDIAVRDKGGKERSESFEWGARQESTAAISIRTGDSFLGLGQYESARTCYMTAVAEASKRGAGGQMDYASLGTAMNAIGHCYFREGRFEEAREWYARAADAKEIVDPPVDHESRGVSLNQVGACLMRMEKYEEAVAWFTRALEAKEQGDAQGRINPESLSNTLHHVGSCLSGMRQYQKAQEYFERAAQQAAEGDLQGRVDHESVGGSLNQVGFCLSRMNQYAAAQGWYERAATEKAKGDVDGRVDHDSVAISMNQVGYCLAGLGRFADAVAWFGRASAAAEKGDVRGTVNRERLATILSLRDQCLEQLKRAGGAAADTDGKR